MKKLGLSLPQKTLAEITTHDLRAFVGELRTKAHMTDKTISRKLSALTNYFTWLVIENVIPHNPALAIPNNKVTSPLPDILYESECTRLLNAASAECRTYLLILLLLETGMILPRICGVVKALSILLAREGKDHGKGAKDV